MESSKQQTRLTSTEAHSLATWIHRDGYRPLAEQIGVHRESLLAAALGLSVRRGTVALVRQALGAQVDQISERASLG